MEIKDHGRYTEAQWEKEMEFGRPANIALPGGRVFAFGTTLPCPHCGTVGFYGPRISGEGPTLRKYRACKFCGFWQEASGELYEKYGGAAYRCRMVHCGNCGTYDWRLPWGDDLGTCNICKNPHLVKAPWPTENPDHPFHALAAQIKKSLRQ
jgi:hypothetical protein